MIKRLSREPLIHFLAVGGALFALHAWLRPAPVAANRVEISRALVDQLTETFRRQWLRPPSESELSALLDSAAREEIFAREAVALGLDRDDLVVRRRLAQKYEFVSRELLGALRPDDAELETYLLANRERYASPERISLEQIYFGGESRRDPRGDAVAALASLRAGAPAGARLGDALLVPRRLEGRTVDEIGSVLGPEFATAVMPLAPGSWQGPIRSTFGWHLVRVVENRPSALPALGEIRAEVERDWLDASRQRAEDELYARLRARYQIVVASEPSGERVASARDLEEGAE